MKTPIAIAALAGAILLTVAPAFAAMTAAQQDQVMIMAGIMERGVGREYLAKMKDAQYRANLKIFIHKDHYFLSSLGRYNGITIQEGTFVRHPGGRRGSGSWRYGTIAQIPESAFDRRFQYRGGKFHNAWLVYLPVYEQVVLPFLPGSGAVVPEEVVRAALERAAASVQIGLIEEVTMPRMTALSGAIGEGIRQSFE